MESYDVIVVGSGSGMMIADATVSRGMKVALVEMDKLGGTCLNRGCIPSKMVIYPADIVNQIKHAERLGVHAEITRIDFEHIMRRTREFVEHDRRPMEESILRVEGLTYYPERGEFVDDYTMRVGDKLITAEHFFLVTGSRPLIPPIEGLVDVPYITSRNVWDMTRRPVSMIIVGGGLIACEMAHFFNAMGTEVTMLSRSPRLIKQGEPMVSEILLTSLRERMHVEVGVEVREAKRSGDMVEVTAEHGDGDAKNYTAEKLFIAAGRKSNADTLNLEKTGVEVDDRGYIVVDEDGSQNEDPLIV